jgi:hypothetical protein
MAWRNLKESSFVRKGETTLGVPLAKADITNSRCASVDVKASWQYQPNVSIFRGKIGCSFDKHLELVQLSPGQVSFNDELLGLVQAGVCALYALEVFDVVAKQRARMRVVKQALLDGLPWFLSP